MISAWTTPMPSIIELFRPPDENPAPPDECKSQRYASTADRRFSACSRRQKRCLYGRSWCAAIWAAAVPSAPLRQARPGVQTIDISVPTLGMHSIRETAGARDARDLCALRRFYDYRGRCQPVDAMNILLLSALRPRATCTGSAACGPCFRTGSAGTQPAAATFQLAGARQPVLVAGRRPCWRRNTELLVATSMVDLATLRGLVPALCRLPTRFAKNQFELSATGRPARLAGGADGEPLRGAGRRCPGVQTCNRETFLAGVDALLRKLPDKVPPQWRPGSPGQVAYFAGAHRYRCCCADASPHWPGVAGVPAAAAAPAVERPLEHDRGRDTLRQVLGELARRAGL